MNHPLSCRRFRDENSNGIDSEKPTAKMETDIYQFDEDNRIERTPEPEPERRYPKRERKQRNGYQMGSSISAKPKSKKFIKQDDDDLEKMDFWYSWYDWSDCKLAKRYDKERNFYPQPGPSQLNYYEDDVIVGYYRSMDKCENEHGKKRTTPQRQSTRDAKTAKKSSTKNKDKLSNNVQLSMLDEDSDWENDIQMQSFYEQSFVQNATLLSNKSIDGADSNSPNSFNSSVQTVKNESPLNTTLSTPVLVKIIENLKNTSTDLKNELGKNEPDACTIKPKQNAPRPSDVRLALNSHEIPKIVHPVPFYSDPNDVLVENSKKEIGHTVLQLAGNAVNDCDEFESLLNIQGMTKWQRSIGLRSMTRHNNTKTIDHPNGIRQRLSRSNKIVNLEPSVKPPTKNHVEIWLKMRAQTIENRSKHCEIINLDDDDDDVKKNINNDIAAIDISKNSEENQQKLPSNTLNNDLYKALCSRKELTVSLVSKQKKTEQLKPQSLEAEKQTDSDDDVICLDEPIQSQNNNHSFGGQLVRCSK